MIPLLQQQRDERTPKIDSNNIATNHTARNNEFWGKEQLVHRHVSESDHYCDPYHILHIRRDATKYEMKRSYQQLALLYHPSLTATTMIMTQHKKSYTEQQLKQERQFLFTLIAASYETLSVKETRQRMDMILLQQQQQWNKKNQIPQHHTSTITAIKSEKHKITSPKNNTKDDKSSNNIIISKAEYKIRKKLREERRVQQQQRRDDSNKKKRNTKHINNNKEPQQTSSIQPHSKSPEIAISPSSSTVSSSYYIHHHHCRQAAHHPIDNDSTHGRVRGDTDSSHQTRSKGKNKDQQNPKNMGVSPSRQCPPTPRKNKKRGYNWAYVSSSCGCHNDEKMENDHHNTKKSDKIPFDEPFDRIDDYDCHSDSMTTTTNSKPVFTVVHYSSNHILNNNNNNYAQPPALVGSSDSEVNDDDDNDSDYLLSLQNITKDFYNKTQPIPTTNTIDATERWFGGPLKLMYRARKFQPFTDPLVLFERTFRSGLIAQEQHQLLPSNISRDCVRLNQSNDKIVGLLPHSSMVSPSTLAIFSSNSNVVPISAADDTIETLPDGTIVTRTHRTIPITTTNTEQKQQETIYKTVTRTITKYPPPDPTSQNNSQHRRMSVAVTSDIVVRIEQNPYLLSSSTSFGGFHKNHCVDCMGWVTCQSSESKNDLTTITRNNEDGNFSFVSMFQAWLPSC